MSQMTFFWVLNAKEHTQSMARRKCAHFYWTRFVGWLKTHDEESQAHSRSGLFSFFMANNILSVENSQDFELISN